MRLDTFTQAYIECALWASTDLDTGRSLDDEFYLNDLAQETLARCVEDCAAFQSANPETLEDPGTAGHDFWLSRNGHGAGFFDGHWGEHGDKLHKASKVYGELILIVGDDGRLYFV